MFFFGNKYFFAPPLGLYARPDEKFFADSSTYSEYNYLRPGISSFIKTRHFEYALKYSKDFFHKTNVIDFGCADGIFLPSLSKHFNHVVGIEKVPAFISTAEMAIHAQGITNVTLINNPSLGFDELKKALPKGRYKVAYLLEVMEHVGDMKDLYGSKICFLKKVFSLLDEKGVIILSVPNMVGMSFLLQRVGMYLLGMQMEKISSQSLLKAVFLKNTDELEQNWNQNCHLGFNERKFEKVMANHFRILKKKWILTQTIYIISADNRI